MMRTEPFTELDLCCPACGSYRSLQCDPHADAVVWRCTFVPRPREVGHDWMPLHACTWFRWMPVDVEGDIAQLLASPGFSNFERAASAEPAT